MASKFTLTDALRAQGRGITTPAIGDFGNYKPYFQQGYQNLGQPGDIADAWSSPPPEDVPTAPQQSGGLIGQILAERSNKGANEAYGRGRVTQTGVQQLADSFVDRYYQKTGKLPDEQQVGDFLHQTVTPAFAQKFIQLGGTTEALGSQYADPYIQSTPDLLPSTGGEDQTGLQTRIDDLYGQARSGVTNQINEQFGKLRGQSIEEEAALGRLRSPASIPQVARVDEERNKTLGNAFASLAGQQATGQLDLSKVLADIGERGREFNADLGLRRKTLSDAEDQTYLQNNLENRKIDLARALGKAQADSQSDDGLSGIFGGALSGAGSGAIVGSTVPGIGTGLGAGIGALIGAGSGFMSRKKR